MAVKLNLLPRDYIVSGPIATILKIAKPANILLLTLFLVFALGVSAFFVLSSLTLKDLNSANEILTTQINSQDKAKQQVVLLKDRLTKIKKVFAKTDTYNNLNSVNPLISDLSDNSAVPDLMVNSEKTDVSLAFTKNNDLTSFVSRLASQKVFSAIIMDSLVFNPLNGYLVQFSFADKK